MKKTVILVIIMITGFFSVPQAQDYHLHGFVGGGYARFITDMGLSGLNKNGYSGTIRIMWQPEHLLRIGLETGYYHLYSFHRDILQTDFGTTEASSSLNALPVFFNIAMQVWTPVELFVGVGPTFLYTDFESFGHRTSSMQMSTSAIVGATYSYKISEKAVLGAELKYYSISKIEDASLTLQILLKYRLLSW